MVVVVTTVTDSYGKKCTTSILRTIDGLTFRENSAVERVSPYILQERITITLYRG